MDKVEIFTSISVRLEKKKQIQDKEVKWLFNFNYFPNRDDRQTEQTIDFLL